MQRVAQVEFNDELPFDFTGHLERRLGVDHAQASTTLADWVGGYQAAKPRPIQFLSTAANDAA